MITTLLTTAVLFSTAEGRIEIDVFHKNMPPSLETLARVDSILSRLNDEYRITCHLITDPSEADIIASLGLPETHFPFAVTIDGVFSAEVDERRVDFVHFPLFMHGIGRHEGNWSLNDLEAVLADTSLLLDESVLPALNEDEEGECPNE